MNALDLVYIPAAVLLSPIWMRKGRKGWSQRFGRVAPMLSGRQTGGKPRLMIHAVSVGETNALRPLVPLLVEHLDVTVSTTTDTGLARAQSLFSETCEVVRYPLDLSSAVERFLDTVRPDVVALVELELWPNFLSSCARRGIPTCVINGRLSENSFKGYSRWKRFTSPMFRRLEWAAVQDDAYAERFRAMGTPEVHIAGTMKWDTIDLSRDPDDVSPEALALGRELGIDASRLLIVAGSTGPGEEAMLHAACPEGVQLACAPRKPERFDEAASALPGCARRSAGNAEGARPTDRFLLDTIGELGLLYQLADVVVIGRTFTPLGGSDPIEPIALGRATVVGPEIANFRSIVETFDAAGGIVRTTEARLPEVLARLIGDPDERRSIAAHGRTCVSQHQGASRRHADLLLGLISGGNAG